MRIKFLETDSSASPAGKLADVELEFTTGPFTGLRLIGFALWTSRNGGHHNVTFPARAYTVNGERRTFALLRDGVGQTAGQDRVRDLIRAAWNERQAGNDVADVAQVADLHGIGWPDRPAQAPSSLADQVRRTIAAEERATCAPITPVPFSF